MSGSDPTDNIFDDIDKNRDGNIDKRELRSWVAKNTGLNTSTSDSQAYGHETRDNTNSRYDRYRYQETISGSTNVTDENVINTNSSVETKRYLERLGNNVFVDSNPKVIRRTTTDRPMTFEQRVFIRCLQPPPLPPPEPIVIKEVRPEQPPPPPPLVIREHSSVTTSQPPIILRERPPTPPSRSKSEITTRVLPPVPLPARSLVIERFPTAPEKPRDIIIERWIPYSSHVERQTVVQRAPPPIQYPAPTHTIIEYDGVQSNVVRKFERAGVTQEDPHSYVSRYGSSLLDSSTLLQEARRLGVKEDISCPVRLANMNAIIHEKSTDLDQSAGGYSYERIHRVAGGEATNLTSKCYSSAGIHSLDDGNQTTIVREGRSGYLTRDSEMI